VFACACANVAIIPAISPSRLTVFQQKNNLFPSHIFIPQHTLQQAQKLPTLKAAEKRC